LEFGRSDKTGPVGIIRPVGGKMLFKFAIVADTHVRLPEDSRLTPWKGQGLAYERATRTLEQVVQAKPKFLIHLGDLTQPVPHLPTYSRTADLAANLFKSGGLPVYFTPGNHDVGDKKRIVTPAHEVDDYSIKLFESVVGPSFQSFDEGGVHFVILNTSLVGSDLRSEKHQQEWLETDLELNRDKRILLFIHYPLFMNDPKEPSLYDNVEEPGRSQILALVERYKIEAIFAGHVHNFFYHDYKGTECYSLLSTCFVRHDYAEIFPVAPDREFGRDDQAKLGWTEVEVYESGHVVHIHRATSPDRSAAAETGDFAPAKPHVKYGCSAALGVHLRTAWAESLPLSYNGPVDEFTRRLVRNDYNLLGLWEMGVRDLRVPLEDIANPAYRSRMATLVAMGHRFTFFVAGIPTKRDESLFAGMRELEGALEIVVPLLKIDDYAEPLRQMRKTWDGRVFLASVVSPSDHRHAAFKGGYVTTSFGFDRTEFDLISDLHRKIGKGLDLGYVFRIPPAESPLQAGIEIDAFAKRENILATLNIALGNENPAVMIEDELRTANRIAEAMLVGAMSERITPFADTYIDQDRGYFPRQGLYDARFNPRPASHVVRNFHSYFSSSASRPVIGDMMLLDDGAICRFEFDRRTRWLLLPAHAKAAEPESKGAMIDEGETFHLVGGTFDRPQGDGRTTISTKMRNLAQPAIVAAKFALETSGQAVGRQLA
jgi:3',5'-cyclic AMP phosphodiesterase CpdA